MSNRTYLNDLTDMTPAQLAAIPLDQVATLLEDAAIMADRAKSYRDALETMLDGRFRERAQAARRAEGKDTGVVRLVEAGCTVVADLPKKPSWNQAKLREISATLTEQGEPVADYIAVELKVAESKWSAWPASLQALFLPARTLGVGKAKYELIAA